MELQSAILDMGRRARAAAHQLVKLSSDQKNRILVAMAEQLLTDEELILAANALDLERARANGLSAAMVDRLTLNPKRLADIARALREVLSCPIQWGR